MSVANPHRTRLNFLHATKDSTDVGSEGPKSAQDTRDGTRPSVSLPMLTEKEYAALRRILERTSPTGLYELDAIDLILGR